MLLKDTIPMMQSENYHNRFRAEYYQVKIRRDRLEEKIRKIDDGTLEYRPYCDRLTYRVQLSAMNDYISALEDRAREEDIDLNLD